MASTKQTTLKSSDGESFVVDETVALQSQMIKSIFDEYCTDKCIPLPMVTGKILSKVIEYCKKHVDAADEDLKTWDADFVKVDHATLFDLIKAANYLDIKSLLDLTCQAVADMIKGKTPEEIRETFNIENENTPEEEEEAANYLDIKSLLDLTCQAVADMIKGKTPEEICETFNVKNELTPEEEEEIRRENQWAFE